MRKMLATLAVAGLVISPVAASANTRAGASVPNLMSRSYKPVKRAGAPVAESEQLVGAGLFLLVGVGLAVSVLAIVSTRSRGA